MCDAADRNNVPLMVGHSQSYSNWVRPTRQIVRSGELGKLGAINVFASSGWLFGTRKLSDLDPRKGAASRCAMPVTRSTASVSSEEGC
jgi:predicted dehydrogenase